MTPPDLPGFTFVRHLGSGGFADVLLYEQEWPKRRVAVKVVRPEVAMSSREKELFRSEANALARLADHPYIVGVINAGETATGLPYLIMRYCPPPDMSARVRVTPLSVAEALSTGVKISSAIETAHRSGILHRDIKPANILITTYHEPALTDFGIAGRIHETDAEGEVRMSYPWAPPELIDGRSRGAVASDVYSLGATIWNLLVGWSPFVLPQGDNSDYALATRILHSPPPRTGRADVPEALDQLLQRCLAKEPSARPTTALELARSLQRIEADLGLPRTPVAVEDVRQGDERQGDVNPDATRVKPMGVVHAQTTSGYTGPGQYADADSRTRAGSAAAREEHGSRSSLIWGVVGIVAAVGLGAALLLNGGGEDEKPQQDPSSSHTPAPVMQDEPMKPEAEGKLRGGTAVFTWTQPDPEPGDRWLWTNTASGQRQQTRKKRLTLPAPRGGAQVCIEISVIRNGSQGPIEPVCAS